MDKALVAGILLVGLLAPLPTFAAESDRPREHVAVTTFGPEETPRAGVPVRFMVEVAYLGSRERAAITLGMEYVDTNDQLWDHERITLQRNQTHAFTSRPYVLPLGHHCASFFAIDQNLSISRRYEESSHTACFDVSHKERPPVQGPLADLRIRAVEPIAQLPPSGPYFRVTVENLGDAASPAAQLMLWMDREYRNATVPSLLPGGHVRVGISPPSGAMDDPSRNLSFVLDAYDHVWESDEDNTVNGTRGSFGPTKSVPSPSFPWVVVAVGAVGGLRRLPSRRNRRR